MITNEPLYQTQKPKILLINFTKSDQELLSAKNYNVERGWAMSGSHYFPSPGYEYDIVFARFDKKGYEASRKLSQYGMSEDDDYVKLAEKLNKSGFLLIFTGEESSNYSFRLCGLDDVDITDLDERDTEYKVSTTKTDIAGYEFSCSILRRISNDIALPINHGIHWRKNSFSKDIPTYPLLQNAEEKVMSCIGYLEEDNVYKLKYVILPRLKKGYVRVVNDFLANLPNWRPDIFPTDSNYSWLKKEEYSSDEIKNFKQKIEKETTNYENKVQELQNELVTKYSEDQYLKQLLIADDSDEFTLGNKLTDVTKLALEFLGFDVVNTEKEVKSGKRREDLICSDKKDGFMTLIECKGTVNQNPSESYISQLLSHLLVSKKDRGTLVINHDRKNDAFHRNLPYEDSKAQWQNSENINIISTVELYKLIRKVQNKEITKEKAKDFIKQLGRLEVE